jgi:hypothetical protein
MRKAAPRTTCPDCGGELHPINLIDHGHYNTPTSPEYREPGAKQNFWTGKWSNAGKVTAKACPDCGRILLYAVPNP